MPDSYFMGGHMHEVGRLVVRVLGVVSVAVAGCAVTVTPQAAEPVSPQGAQANATEATAGYVSGVGTTIPAHLLAMWNDPFEGMAIARSSAPGVWTQCTRRDCGPGGAAIVTAAHQLEVGPAPLVGQFLGDPAIAGVIAQPGVVANGVVVAANLGESTSPHSSQDAVVAIASFDGGESWGGTVTRPATIVVNQGTGPCDIDRPGGTSVDRERIAFDPSGPPSTFWIAFAGGGQLCLRSVRADPATQTITSPGPTISVPFAGIGAVIVRARGGRVFVMYSIANTSLTCGARGMSWRITSSVGGTGPWTDTEVFSTNAYDECFGTLPVFDTTNGNFGFDIAPDGTLWAAVHDTQTSIRVFSSSDGAMWTPSVPLGAGFGGAEVGQPWLAVDLAGNVGVSYYRAVSLGAAELQRWIAVRDASTGTWSLPAAMSPAFTPNIIAADGSSGRIGDYQGLTLIDPSQFPGGNSFLAVWDEIDPLDSTHYFIDGARVAVTP